MTEDFIYIGARPRKAWAGFDWASVASSRAAVSKLLATLDGRRRAVLVVSEPAGWRWLVETLSHPKTQRRWRSRVLGLAKAESGWAVDSLLDTRFERCVRRPPVMLALKQLVEVLGQSDRGDFCIGGSIERAHQLLVLVRGDLELVSVPLSCFAPTADGVVPDFDDFEIVDHGQTLRFGDYEASFEAVLYEMDEAYRRRLLKARRSEEQSFGASLRRLRIQRGLARDAFAPEVSAKSIARIERGEVAKPQQRTLRHIARRLRVAVEAIGTF